jgi:hypothetical protein
MSTATHSTEALVQIADRLYKARRTLRRLSGDDYDVKVRPYMALLHKHAGGDPGRYMATAILISGKLAQAAEDFAVLWVLAAVVELCEPDGVSPKLEGA